MESDFFSLMNVLKHIEVFGFSKHTKSIYLENDNSHQECFEFFVNTLGWTWIKIKSKCKFSSFMMTQWMDTLNFISILDEK